MEKIKLSIDNNNVKYYINKQKKTVSCVLKFWITNCPNPFYSDSDYTVVGTAKCADDDVFNEEIGKKIAQAKAEIKAYRKVAYMFNTQVNKHKKLYVELLMSTKDIFKRYTDVENHNMEYIKRLSDEKNI